MARQFGGKHSPQAKGASPAQKAAQVALAEDRRVDAAGAKSNLMFAPPVILAFTSLTGGPVALTAGLIGAAILALAAWLLREGLRAEAAFAARPIARRPALPRKILAAALTGIGVAIAASMKAGDVVGGLLYGIAAGGLHLAAFGLDPLKDKRVEGIDTFQQERVARVVDEAETYLNTIRDQIAALNDRALETRVASFRGLVRQMIRTVEEDPRDLTQARKYLGVYLMGARDATVKFADLYRRTGDAQARADYEALLTDLEANFAASTQKMLEGGRTDMDIEIKVLRDRLQREGVRAPLE
ncbi:MAG: 5-bromo-4-chloroindolyl phosphate hydrolysis family protein [Rubellimicrobium sp.]|nr:5-bromo-4-chloroindolyl phosphate hydrolysis family protein [Rubellimicrobium sp.]